MAARATVLTGFLLAAAALPAFAADKKPEAGAAFGDWQVECEAAADGKPRCFLAQTQMLKENNARLLKMSVGYIGPKGEAVLVALLPLGIDLRAGVVMKLDEGGEAPLVLQQCVQDGCVASKALDAKGLAAFVKAQTLRLGVLPYAGKQSVTMTVSLKGVSAGLDALR
ncbi:invasion associated locus B family protein [Azospirillum doebereinerae]|uniref:invasion associated locus B family protein n=1 Tax=Azospirillum doebereinerae TaxID=92933 RepID=UPI001EE5A57D|nr:invasion associated locus B family protein [Azospirillum doebereinerae]MCG5238629.1 invasion associated locus B family protein [Azospirillum doebereinerae]